jgi:urease accessory protein
MTMISLRRALPLLLLAPAWALAHVGADAAAHHGFMSGFIHPFTGLDHLAAMLAVGLWSALTTRIWQERMRAPLVFAVLLLAGALLGTAGLTLPAVEPVVVSSLLVLGLLVATRCGLPPLAGAGLVGTFALFHGLAHGQELGGASALGGMVLATLLLHGAGLLIGHRLQPRSAWWSRGIGAATALLGAALLLA